MTEQSRYENGTQILETYHHDAWKALQENVADIAPDLAKFVAEWAFGDIYTREGLDLR